MPNESDLLGRLEKSVRQGDWNTVIRLAERIGGEPLSATPSELGTRLRRLQTALVAARVARANLAFSLTRVRAAASFSHSRIS